MTDRDLPPSASDLAVLRAHIHGAPLPDPDLLRCWLRAERVRFPCRLQVLAETEAGTIESGQFLIERMGARRPAPGLSSSG